MQGLAGVLELAEGVARMTTQVLRPLVALVFRDKTGCRQYPFHTVGDLRAWAARHPYRDEDLKVRVVRPSGMLADMHHCHAREIADYVDGEVKRANG